MKWTASFAATDTVTSCAVSLRNSRLNEKDASVDPVRVGVVVVRAMSCRSDCHTEQYLSCDNSMARSMAAGGT